jgi:hypothetical protein
MGLGGDVMRAVYRRVPARLVTAILGFLGFVNAYAMRVNLSVAINSVCVTVTGV